MTSKSLTDFDALVDKTRALEQQREQIKKYVHELYKPLVEAAEVIVHHSTFDSSLAAEIVPLAEALKKVKGEI